MCDCKREKIFFQFFKGPPLNLGLRDLGLRGQCPLIFAALQSGAKERAEERKIKGRNMGRNMGPQYRTAIWGRNMGPILKRKNGTHGTRTIWLLIAFSYQNNIYDTMKGECHGESQLRRKRRRWPSPRAGQPAAYAALSQAGASYKS